MNKERILELADHIEKLPQDDFDMSQWVHHCGGPACVAGYTVAKYRPTVYDKLRNLDMTAQFDAFTSVAANILSATEDEVHQLFFTHDEYGEINELWSEALNKFDPEDDLDHRPDIAAWVLRRFVELHDDH